MAALAQPLAAQKVVVTFQFKGIEKGYDHETRCVLFVDGKEAAVSETKIQSKGGRLAAKLPPGRHVLRVVNYALYEGKWEEHTKANDYSQDCTFDGEFEFGKKRSKLNLALTFDLDAGATAEASGKNFKKI